MRKDEEFGNKATKLLCGILEKNPFLLREAKKHDDFDVGVRRALYWFSPSHFWYFSGNWSIVRWNLLEQYFKKGRKNG